MDATSLETNQLLKEDKLQIISEVNVFSPLKPPQHFM